jgi:hypothetical protein
LIDKSEGRSALGKSRHKWNLRKIGGSVIWSSLKIENRSRLFVYYGQLLSKQSAPYIIS